LAKKKSAEKSASDESGRPVTGASKAAAAESHMSVTWKVVAVVLFIVCLGLLITLIIVGAAADAESLNTTAIALAVIAFGVQLIVYVAQVSDSSDTRRQTADINAATQASLARIGTTVANSDQMLRDHYANILQDLLGSVRRAGVEAKESNAALSAGDVLELIEHRLARGPSAMDDDDDFDEDDDWEESPPWVDPFAEWPNEEEARRVHAVLLRLDPVSIGQLIRFVDDYRNSVQLDISPGLVYFGPQASLFTAPLIEAGLVHLPGRPPRTSLHKPRFGYVPEIAELTEEGVVAGRLLLGGGVAPDYVQALISTNPSPPAGAPEARP
jgi:heme/copper-type cytochrome/quinol oxidase subunit 4